MDWIDSLDEREYWLYRWRFCGWEFGIRHYVKHTYLREYDTTCTYFVWEGELGAKVDGSVLYYHSVLYSSR